MLSLTRDQMGIKARKGMIAKRVMAAANSEQCHFVLSYHGLVPSVTYIVVNLTLSHKKMKQIILILRTPADVSLSCNENSTSTVIQYEAMRIKLGCTKDTVCKVTRYLINFPSVEDRTNI